ncbi:MAG: hypothetical protein H6546_06860 [Chitinophagales bacterium]|nr:hypothetical protein [Chitinophagales bacterium]HAE14698.1 hypothetical protein [Bacteroidota bacterium]MCB9020032.1 hypothetical protein [Chitinophagales bacterium]MCB9031601.1 hypothetical protein [Chitinophagales bacterium]HPR30395.1 hypothetical protein [Chitinophagales bacterium]
MKNKDKAFDYISRWTFEDAGIAEKLSADPGIDEEDKAELTRMFSVFQTLLKKSSQYDAMSQEENKRVSIEVNNMAVENMRNTYGTIMSIKTSLQDVIKDAKRAYTYVLWMYILAFLMGVGLIVLSVVFAIQGKDILAIAFGGIGLIDLVTYFIYKPPLEIQNSRSNLAQLMIIITNWFADLMNLNTYMSNRNAIITLEEIDQISEKQNQNTAKTIDLIEKYSESKGK